MKIKKINFILLIILFLIPSIIKAETCDNDSIKLISIYLEEKSEGITELEEATIENNKIKVNIKILELNDYIKYKLVLKNESDQDYNLDNSISNSDDTISYTILDVDNKSTIAPGETKEIYLLIEYKNKVDSSNFENGTYTKNEDIVLTLLSNDNNDIINPNTSIISPKIMLIVIPILILSIMLFIKLKRISYLGIFILSIILLPKIVYALCTCKVDVISQITIPEYSERNLYNVIKEDVAIDDTKSKYVTSDSGVNFLEPSSETNGNGKYIFAPTKEDTNPIIYYRGMVEDNNILFANYCWKILRTTENGGIKIVYNGVSTDGKCLSEGIDTQIASNVKYNASYSNLKSFGYSVTSTSGRTMKYKQDSNVANGTIYSNDVTYEDGKYILNNDRYIKDGGFSNDRDTVLTTHHYTCFKTDDTGCTSVNYIYMTRGTVQHYVVLSGGEKIEDVIDKEITNEPNTNKSDIRNVVDNWYQSNMTEYSNYLDDAVWCNDRSLYTLGGWEKNGDPTVKLTFNTNYRVSTLGKPSLTCSNKNDKFTIDEANGNGSLEYPIGLLTLDEANLAGFAWYIDSETYLSNGNVWWTMSPSLQSANYMYVGVVHSMTDNVHTAYNGGSSGGVRPAVVLKKIVKIKDGDGTKNNPFTIEELR